MKIIDLSLPIDEKSPEVHPFWIERVGHKEGIKHLNWVMMKKDWIGKIKFFLGQRIIKPEDLDSQEFLSLETVHCPVHIGTHIDFSFHYGSQSEGRPSKTINELPLEWCMGDGVVLDFTSKKPGERIMAADIEEALKKIKYNLKMGDIVLLRTDAYKFFGKKEYLGCYPGVDPSALEFILNKGINIIGVDTLGFDRPYKFMMADFMKDHDASVLWPAHFFGRKREYAHIERLANLDKLPSTGFKISCLPVKINNVGAAWSRVVAIIN